MLYGQLPHSTDEVREASIGFDIKLLKGELKTGRKPSATKYTQLEDVISELQSSELVGNIWSGKPYISATLTMIWASFGDDYYVEGREAPITFWGYTDDHVALGLAGSSYHVLGHKRPDGHAHSHSVTPAIESWLIKHVKDTRPEDTLDSYSVCSHIWLAVSQITGTPHQYEFVAKVLDRSPFDPSAHPSEKTNNLLATPLYVAQLD